MTAQAMDPELVKVLLPMSQEERHAHHKSLDYDPIGIFGSDVRQVYTRTHRTKECDVKVVRFSEDLPFKYGGELHDSKTKCALLHCMLYYGEKRAGKMARA